MKIRKSLLPVVCLGLLGGSHAAADVYLGGGVLLADIDVRGGSDEAEPGALFATLGTTLTPYLSIEGRFGLGLYDDETNVFGGRAEVEIEEFAGGYLLATVPTNIPLSPYLALGITQMEVETSRGGFVSQEDETDLSLGLGLRFANTQRTTFNGEYMQYIDDDGTDVSGLALGFTYFF